MLNTDKFFRRTTTGTLMMKRISAAQEERFPRALREVYRDAENAGQAPATVLTKHVMNAARCSLTEAWTRVKWMFAN